MTNAEPVDYTLYLSF